MINNSCVELLERLGVGWVLEQRRSPQGTVFLDNLGDREDGLRDVTVFRSNGSSVVRVPKSDKINNIGVGDFSFGLFFNLKAGSDDGLEHVIIDKPYGFRLWERSGVLFLRINGLEDVYASTISSGKNFCDGKTYLVFGFRSYGAVQSILGLEVYDVCRDEVSIDNDFDLTFDSHITLSGALDPGVTACLPEDSKLSGFFFSRGILTKVDKTHYWLHGNPVDGPVLFMKLDEGSDSTVFDSSGSGLHGSIIGYNNSWGVDDTFFSWQNMCGYTVDGVQVIPSLLLSSSKDIRGDALTYPGRAMHKVHLTDILSFYADGGCYGEVPSPTDFHYRPGQDMFSVVLVLGLNQNSAGLVFSVGDRYSLSVGSGGLISVMLGGTITELVVGVGEHTIILNVGLTEAELSCDGAVVGTCDVGSTYSSGGMFSLFDDGGSVLGDTVLAFLGIGAYLEESDVSLFHSGDVRLDKLGLGLYFYPSGGVVYDITGNGRHVEIVGYTSGNAVGRQSKVHYLLNGFTMIFPSTDSLGGGVLVPYRVDGKPMGVDVYGEGQVNVEYISSGGLLVFDAFLDMNPENKRSGFWSQFWDKSNTVYWRNLEDRYKLDSDYKWHISELMMSYLLRVLTNEGRNFVFSGSVSGRYNLVTEIHDLVVLNTGNNIKPKAIVL